MKWLKRSLLSLAVLIALAAVVPLLISLDDYIPRIEEEATTWLKEPVSIESIRFAALPTPHVTISGIAVGKSGDMKVARVSISPDLLSMLREGKVIRSVEIDSLDATQGAIDRILAWAKADARQPPPTVKVRVERIRVSSALVRLDTASFGPFDALVQLDARGQPADASITTQDGKLKILVKPDQANYLIDVSAKAWTLPAGPPLLFDELSLKGVATHDDVTLDEVKARLYGGTAAGKMSMSWKNGLQVKGSFAIGQLELKQIASMLSPGTHVSGKLDAKPAFSAAAPTPDQLVKALRLETDFNVRNGTLHGVDIQKAATSPIKQRTTGGETRFEHLAGHLRMEHGSRHFTNLDISSGALAADGRVTVTPGNDLSGRINAQVKAMGTSARVALNVSGTTHAPLLYPTGGTMAGAAIGTVIMGPGFGTSVGAKVGGWAEGLFDGKSQQAPKK